MRNLICQVTVALFLLPTVLHSQTLPADFSQASDPAEKISMLIQLIDSVSLSDLPAARFYTSQILHIAEQ